MAASWIGLIEVGRPSLRLRVHGTSRWAGVRDEQKGTTTEHQHLSPYLTIETVGAIASLSSCHGGVYPSLNHKQKTFLP